MKINENYLFSIVLVHVSRTWERIRLEQDNQEMPYDNIESVDKIIEISEDIMNNSVIEKFLFTEIDEWDWEKESGVSCSDTFIEGLATELIYSDILGINNISKEDYIIWDSINNKPLEDLDIVYHYSSIIEMINTVSLKLREGEEIRPIAELPLKWKLKYNQAIEDNK